MPNVSSFINRDELKQSEMKRELVDGGSAYGLVSIVTEPSARLCFVLGVASVIDGPWLACRWQVAVGWAHPAAAPLSALLRIGGKRKPRSTEASGASRTGNLGAGMGGVVSRPLTRDNGAGWIRFRGQSTTRAAWAMLAAIRRASSRVSSLAAARHPTPNHSPLTRSPRRQAVGAALAHQGRVPWRS
jgi:hypothetical protein